MGDYLNNQIYDSESRVKGVINYFFNNTSNAFFYNDIRQLQEHYQTVIENNSNDNSDSGISTTKLTT
ncbi:hypothetical protein CONCODRAFT_11967 [Conidiobolus coronatus NRRL 28638]|uniref:Uncharacterized protein n=1 Tax=Conidiobolus coronatus (strain ATCC 28846 / CBS 209.66 / NRRL 28638) TaxID=796925 RepID=A0A137NU21_CONC2|nr:hypothetical protein CONCODRAFT_11967 [Conidiobolus coronatus NRRL 28638]|eukprot:KXN66242.1 hypothetical protein CONCODRAFT_11967 [Conidiobolus coronatus NRRL 28638]